MMRIHWIPLYLLLGMNLAAVSIAIYKTMTKPTMAEQAFNSCMEQKVSAYMCYMSMRNPINFNEAPMRRKK